MYPNRHRGELTLDCQDCGAVLKTLTPAQAGQIADHPERFIVFCRTAPKTRPPVDSDATDTIILRAEPI